LRVTLPERLSKLVNQKLDCGLYDTREAVIEAALLLLDERDKKLAALRNDIQEGLASGTGRIFDEGVVEDIIERGGQQANPRKKSWLMPQAIILSSAESDLTEIWAFIARNGPQNANRFGIAFTRSAKRVSLSTLN
jgi:putative addiction module CopG family antidote